MSEGNRINFFCRGYGYSLQGLESARCPECGREFDRTKPKTMSRSSRSVRNRKNLRVVLAASIGLLTLGYVGTYLNLVEARMPPPRGFSDIWDYPTPTPAAAAYPNRFVSLDRIFRPINWLDRRIRRDNWTCYTIGAGRFLPHDMNATSKTLFEAVQLNREDLQQRQREMLGLMMAMHQFRVGSKGWNDYKSRVIAIGELLRLEMQQPPARSATATDR